MLVGPSGAGKTTMPLVIAEKLGVPCIKIDCGTVRDPEEWFGRRDAADGKTHFTPSVFTEALEKGGVIILDELNRVQPYILSTLFGALDDTRQITVHNKTIKVSKDCTIVATINEGLKYSGTFRLDEALRQRFDLFVNVGYPENEERVYASYVDKATADKIAAMLISLRSYDEKNNWGIDASVRTGVKIAKIIENMVVDLRDAVELTIYNSIHDLELKKNVIDVANSVITSK